MNFLPIVADHIEDLAADHEPLQPRHHFEPRQLMAINAALSASRPLLVRGEPGIGKSQLARAAAKALGRAFIQYGVVASTEYRDLLWHFDAAGRLAEAQVMGALQVACPSMKNHDTLVCDPAEQALKLVHERLDIREFLHPGALWWAFNWKSAVIQADKVGEGWPPQLDGGDFNKGSVVLIDEIDKAESDVPNGLLEVLGAARFTPQGCNQPVEAEGPPPLVVITTNEERALPDTFIRRCLVLNLRLPKERNALITKLIGRGHTHFSDPKTGKLLTTPTLLRKAAELLADDRAAAEQRHWRPLPGQAEYLDLVRAVVVQGDGDIKLQEELITQIGQFVLKKHPEAAGEQDEN